MSTSRAPAPPAAAQVHPRVVRVAHQRRHPNLGHLPGQRGLTCQHLDPRFESTQPAPWAPSFLAAWVDARRVATGTFWAGPGSPVTFPNDDCHLRYLGEPL